VSGLCLLRLPPHTAQHAGRDADTARGCTGEPGPSETLVGCHPDDGKPSSSRVSDRWRDALDRAGCWSLASGGLRAPHTSLPCCPGSSVVHAGHWLLQPWWRHAPQSDVIVDRVQTPASLGAVVPGITGCETARATPYGQET